MKLIGITGKMGSGKDYITTKYIIPFIENKLNKKCIQFSFADQLKINTMTKNNIKFNDMFYKKTNLTRTMLQKEGTENGRNVYGEDVWIKYFSNWVKLFEMRNFDFVITSDVRFKNELKYIKDNKGIIIKIIAPERTVKRLIEETNGNKESYNKIKNHISECDLDNIKDDEFDLIINNCEKIEDKIIENNLKKIFYKK
jgi:phosphomevalonate kinase